MSEVNSTRFRLSAILPLVTSAIAFALVIVLVLSGTDPGLVPDTYLLSFNTTSWGTNLLEINAIVPITTAVPVANSGRDIPSAPSLRSIIADQVSTSSTASRSSNSSVDSSSARTSEAPAFDSNSTPSDPHVLAIPQTSGTPDPAAIPISLVSVAFQFMLNTFAAGTGAALEDIVTSLITTVKQKNGVAPIYTMHSSGICQANITTTDPTTFLNTTDCFSYNYVGFVLGSFIGNTPDFVLIGASNITVPLLRTPPGTAEAVQSFFNVVATIVLVSFVISLVGNGLSFVLSIAAFFMPSNGTIHTTAAGITTFSAQILQILALTATCFASCVTSGINSFSEATGLSASADGNFLVLIWISYVAAQAANIYWSTTWSVEFRTTAFQRRKRTTEEMQAGYRAIGKELRRDFRLIQAEVKDTEAPVKRPLDIKHWDDHKHV